MFIDSHCHINFPELAEKLDEVLANIKPIKPTAPANPQQARIDALKKQKSAITKNLDAERNRQKIAKAQQQIRTASQKIL